MEGCSDMGRATLTSICEGLDALDLTINVWLTLVRFSQDLDDGGKRAQGMDKQFVSLIQGFLHFLPSPSPFCFTLSIFP